MPSQVAASVVQLWNSALNWFWMWHDGSWLTRIMLPVVVVVVGWLLRAGFPN